MGRIWFVSRESATAFGFNFGFGITTMDIGGFYERMFESQYCGVKINKMKFFSTMGIQIVVLNNMPSTIYINTIKKK